MNEVVCTHAYDSAQGSLCMNEPLTSAPTAGESVGTSCTLVAGSACHQRPTGAVASDHVTLRQDRPLGVTVTR